MKVKIYMKYGQTEILLLNEADKTGLNDYEVLIKKFAATVTFF